MTLPRSNSVRNLVLSFPVLVLWPNFTGLVIFFLLYCLINFGLSVLSQADKDKAKDVTSEMVCEFIEIFLLGTNAGLNKLETLNLVAETVSDPIRHEINDALARCNLGISLVSSLAYSAEQFPKLAPAIKAISRSEITGGAVTDALGLELMLNRAQSVNEVLRRVRSLSVKCVLPLGLCFLPAFFLATIVPILASLLPNIFSTIR